MKFQTPTGSTRHVLLLAAVVLLAGLAGCSGGGSAEETPTPEPQEESFGQTFDTDSGEVHRFVDEEAEVVCYVFDEHGASASGAGWQSGISCVPLDDTRLSRSNT